MRVDQLMHGGRDAPIVKTDTPMRDVISEITKKTLGMTCVVQCANELSALSQTAIFAGTWSTTTDCWPRQPATS